MSVQVLYFLFSSIMIAIGLYGIASKRNLFKTIISIEIITMGVNLALAAAGFQDKLSTVDAEATGMVILSMAVAACIAAISLSILIAVYSHYKTIDSEKVSKLRW